jgi:hypothetical protein
MRPKHFTLPLIIVALLFISIGDRVLPQPLSTYSFNTRTSLNNFLSGLFPQKRFKNPNDRTEKAVEQLQKREGK